MLLCSCLQHFQTRQFHHISLSNLFYSTMTFVCDVLRIIVLMNWEIMCKTCSKHIVKYSQTLYYLLEVIFFLAVVILNLFLYLLEPLYKTCLHPRSLSRFSLVQYFWNLASKVFLSTCYGYVSFTVLQHLVKSYYKSNSGMGYSVPFHLAATALILTLSALPYRSLTVSYLVIVTTFGESVDASSTHPTDLPLLFPVLYLFLGMLLSYPCINMVRQHHHGVFFSMVWSGQKGLLHLLFSLCTTCNCL